MTSTGLNRETGAPLAGFEHVRQSIGVILTTPIGSRIMRREFGSEVFDLIDRPMTDQVILAIYAASVMAIARWEPRYEVSGCRIVKTEADGTIEIELAGTYFPRGHLGDFSVAESASLIVPFVRTGIER